MIEGKCLPVRQTRVNYTDDCGSVDRRAHTYEFFARKV